MNQLLFYKNLIFLLFLNSRASMSSDLAQDFCWKISFLNYFSFISLILTSRSFYFKINNFFYYQILLLLYYTSRLLIFSSQFFQDYLYSLSNLLISSSIQEIISMVTILGLPFLIFYLFYLIFSQTYFIFLVLLTNFSCAFSNNFSFYTVLATRTLHSSLSLLTCALDFSIFQLYLLSFFKKFKAFSCSFLTFINPAFQFSNALISFSNYLMLFSFQMTDRSSQTYSISFLSSNSQFLSYKILISCFLVYRRCTSVCGSNNYSKLIPYFFFLSSPLVMIQSICSASYNTWFLSRLFCSMSLSRLISFTDDYLTLDQRLSLLCMGAWFEIQPSEPTDLWRGWVIRMLFVWAALIFLGQSFIQLCFLQIYSDQRFIFRSLCGLQCRIKDWDEAAIATVKDILIEIQFHCKQISMGDTCSSARFSKDFQVPQLKERNSYGYSDDTPDDKVVMSVFSQSYDENRKSRIISMIQSSRQHLFQDDKFKITESQAQRLSVLFNFEASRTRIFSKKEETDLTSFIQMNAEMSYLAAVFYLLCRKEAKNSLLPRLVQNQETNNYGAYSTSLFCNGQTHQVIVDDRMPTHNDDFLYLRIVKGIQLWPLILEKAWCKQIGSYERAKGLSTQDAFEEITGIPAYTYNLRANNRSSLKTMVSAAMGKGYWIALIARSGLSDLINQQVFYLQSINGNEYTIISPYVSYNFDNYTKNQRGEVKVRQQDIFSHFEQIVIGYYKPNHVNLTVPVVSKSREELVFQINVANQEEVSIRFNQLYQGYLANSDRPHYQYSPLMMELYQIKETNGMRKKCRIVDNCQGCSRSIMGTRSSKCSGGIMQTLQGKYLLRLQVGWNYEGIINKGNLVIYASQNNVQVSQLKNTQLLFKEIYPILFQNEGKKYILHEHNLEVITFDKQKTTLIMFHNVTNTPHHFQVDFTTSINVRLRGREVKGRRAVIRLQADQKELIQVMPQDLREIMEIKNFEIIKLAIK